MAIEAQIVEQIVCSVFGIEKEQLHAGTRKREAVVARQVVMKMLCLNNYSEKQAGLYFKKTRCTAIHAGKQVQNLCETDKDFRQKFYKIRRLIAIENNEPFSLHDEAISNIKQFKYSIPYRERQDFDKAIKNLKQVIEV